MASLWDQLWASCSTIFSLPSGDDCSVPGVRTVGRPGEALDLASVGPMNARDLNLRASSVGLVTSPWGQGPGFVFCMPENPKRPLFVTSRRLCPDREAAMQAMVTFDLPDRTKIRAGLDPINFFLALDKIEVHDAGQGYSRKMYVDLAIAAFTDPRGAPLIPFPAGRETLDHLLNDTVIHVLLQGTGTKAMDMGVVTQVKGLLLTDSTPGRNTYGIVPVLNSRWEVVALGPSKSGGSTNESLYLRALVDYCNILVAPYMTMPALPAPGGGSLRAFPSMSTGTPSSTPGRSGGPQTPKYATVGPSSSSSSQQRASLPLQWSVSGVAAPAAPRVAATPPRWQPARYDSVDGQIIQPQPAGSPLRPGEDPNTVVWIREREGTNSTSKVPKYHHQAKCHGASMPLPLWQAREHGRKQCEFCAPYQGGSVVDEIRAFKRLFGSSGR
eukprot:tig00020554_g10872.t1